MTVLLWNQWTYLQLVCKALELAGLYDCMNLQNNPHHIFNGFLQQESLNPLMLESLSLQPTIMKIVTAMKVGMKSDSEKEQSGDDTEYADSVTIAEINYG